MMVKTKCITIVIIRSFNINSVVIIIEDTRLGGGVIAVIDRSADEIEWWRNIDNFGNVVVVLIVDCVVIVVDGKSVLAETK